MPIGSRIGSRSENTIAASTPSRSTAVHMISLHSCGLRHSSRKLICSRIARYSGMYRPACRMSQMGVKSVGSRRQARMNGVSCQASVDCGVRSAEFGFAPQSAIRTPQSEIADFRRNPSLAGNKLRRLLRRLLHQDAPSSGATAPSRPASLRCGAFRSSSGRSTRRRRCRNRGAQFVDQAQLVGQLEQVDHLVGRGEHRDVDFAGDDAADILPPAARNLPAKPSRTRGPRRPSPRGLPARRSGCDS